MKIIAFERNAEDQVVAIGDTKIVLPWDYVIEHKPQVGDYISYVDGKLVPVDEPIEEIEPAPKGAALEPVVEEPIAEPVVTE